LNCDAGLLARDHALHEAHGNEEQMDDKHIQDGVGSGYRKDEDQQEEGHEPDRAVATQGRE
jgi:hypothetical protein